MSVAPTEGPRARPGRSRRVLVVVGVMLLVPLLVALLGWRWWQHQLDPPGRPGAAVAVEVREGWGVAEIADALAAAGVVDSGFVFKVYVRMHDAGPFQAGRYPMARDLGTSAAVRRLEAGPEISYAELRVPPGLRLTEIAARVGRQIPGRSAEKFLAAARSGAVRSRYQPPGAGLEGLLWPDTYRVSESEDETDVLRLMVEEFDARADAAGLGEAAVDGLTPYEVLTVASLVQGEAKLDRDRPLIASVVYNRLRDDMPLQIDASVLYGVGKRSGLTAADLRTDGPYNTYTRRGLPPGPIAAVAGVSLEAAMAPASTPYLFYVVADAEGGHAFARTYEEHLANVDAARRAGLL